MHLITLVTFKKKVGWGIWEVSYQKSAKLQCIILPKACMVWIQMIWTEVLTLLLVNCVRLRLLTTLRFFFFITFPPPNPKALCNFPFYFIFLFKTPGDNLLNWFLDTLVSCGPYLKNPALCSSYGQMWILLNSDVKLRVLVFYGLPLPKELLRRKLHSLNERNTM